MVTIETFMGMLTVLSERFKHPLSAPTLALMYAEVAQYPDLTDEEFVGGCMYVMASARFALLPGVEDIVRAAVPSADPQLTAMRRFVDIFNGTPTDDLLAHKACQLLGGTSAIRSVKDHQYHALQARFVDAYLRLVTMTTRRASVERMLELPTTQKALTAITAQGAKARLTARTDLQRLLAAETVEASEVPSA